MAVRDFEYLNRTTHHHDAKKQKTENDHIGHDQELLTGQADDREQPPVIGLTPMLGPAIAEKPFGILISVRRRAGNPGQAVDLEPVLDIAGQGEQKPPLPRTRDERA